MARTIIDTKDPPSVITIVLPADAEDGEAGGKFKHITCSGAVSHHTLERFVDEETGAVEYSIRPTFRQKGYRTLKELYLEDDNPDGFKEFERWKAANFGKVRPKEREFPVDKLPTEVRRRRGLEVEETPRRVRGRRSEAVGA